jgi:hypothetical protein
MNRTTSHLCLTQSHVGWNEVHFPDSSLVARTAAAVGLISEASIRSGKVKPSDASKSKSNHTLHRLPFIPRRIRCMTGKQKRVHNAGDGHEKPAGRAVTIGRRDARQRS